MRYFVKLSFMAKEQTAAFALKGAERAYLLEGFKAFKEVARRLDGTAIDTDRDLAALVEMIANKAGELSGGVIKILLTGSMILAYYRTGDCRDITLAFFTVHQVRAAVKNEQVNLYSN